MKDRISVNPNIHFGKPCVVGTRITVQSVLELVRKGLPFTQIIQDYYPDLQVEDIRACIQYADERELHSQLQSAAKIVFAKLWDNKEDEVWMDRGDELWEKLIEINPRIKGGKPVIKGTRVPVEVIVGALAGGASWEEVGEAYEVTLEQMRACLAFAAQMLAEETFVAVPA